MINPKSIFTKFKYLSAECGSGKTTKLCEMINEVLTIEGNTDQFIIVQNTQKLAKQTAKNFADYKLIISEVKNSKKNVLTSVLDFLNKPTSRVLIISDKTFFKIPVDLLQGWQNSGLNVRVADLDYYWLQERGSMCEPAYMVLDRSQ